jgi:7-carboxy-7-deazaguanine synthase
VTTKLRVSEIYLSIQGEGPRVGAPTVFIRFAGCNLRCPDWACDTPHAIFPELFRKDAKLLTTEEIVKEVERVAPGGANICYTGGEPFLQNHEALQALVEAFPREGYQTQEAFTNGTLEYPDWAYEHIFFVTDWKLTGSGEEANIFGTEGTQKTRLKNVERMNVGDTVKFTIAHEKDYEEAQFWYNNLHQLNPNIEFIYGVVWGHLEPKDLIRWVLRDQLVEWTYSHQLHNVIWDRTERGI